MKNFISLVYFILLVTIISCSNKLFSEKVPHSERENIRKAIENERQIKETYGKLTPLEKSKIWHNRIKKIIKNENLNELELKYLKDLIRIINSALFVTGNGNNDLIEEYRLKGIALFGKARADIYFATLTIDYTIFRNIIEYNYDTIPPKKNSKKDTIIIIKTIPSSYKCNCSTVSDFCYGFSDCLSSSCQNNDYECGFLWKYRCDGVCK